MRSVRPENTVDQESGGDTALPVENNTNSSVVEHSMKPITVEMSQLKIDLEAKFQTEVKNLYQTAQIKTNHSYVMFFVLTFLCGSTLQAGWVLTEFGQVGLVLDQKLGWNAFADDAPFLNYFTITSVLPFLGMCFGCYFGGVLLPKFGSRKIIIAANIVSLIFQVVKMMENTTTLIVARFITGITLGITCVCLSRAINDTVPAKNSPQYGAFVNAGFGIGIFFSNLMGLLIPINNGEEGDIQKMKDDQNWRLVIGVPIILQIYTLIALVFIIKHESIIQLLQNEEESSELLETELKKVYTLPASMTYNQLAFKLRGEIKFSDPIPCSIWEGLTKQPYRRASYNALILACAHQLTGISGVTVFLTTIFLKLQESGQIPIKAIYCVQIINFVNMIMCASYPILSKFFRQKSAILTGQFGMVLALFGTMLFNEIDQNILMILFLALFFCFFEFGIGTIAWIHIFETTVDSITGLANQTMFFVGFCTTMITPTLIKKLTVSGMLIIFGTFNLFFLLYMIFFVKQTSSIEIDENGQKQIIEMTEKNKKELYWPEEYKTKSAKEQQTKSEDDQKTNQKI